MYARELEVHNMCARKHVYMSEMSALTAAQKHEVSLRKQGKKLRAYRCPNCKFWHLTSKERNDG